jgi:hypothetical protein
MNGPEAGKRSLRIVRTLQERLLSGIARFVSGWIQHSVSFFSRHSSFSKFIRRRILARPQPIWNQVSGKIRPYSSFSSNNSRRSGHYRDLSYVSTILVKILNLLSADRYLLAVSFESFSESFSGVSGSLSQRQVKAIMMSYKGPLHPRWVQFLASVRTIVNDAE